jgi:uncharacterized protein YhfF
MAMDAEIRKILELAFPGEEARYFEPIAIGSVPSVADSGALAILSGTKTATSSALWEHPTGKIPVAGALSVLVDGQDRPRAIVETRRAEVVPFGSVDEDFARAYGEGEQTLAWWRSEIGADYRASAARHGEEFSDDTPIVCEWIAVVRRRSQKPSANFRAETEPGGL